MKLSEKILALRKARCMSQEELAEALGVSRQAVSRWEGDSALPDANNVLQLSKLFGVSADYLLDESYGSTPVARPSAPEAEAAAPRKESRWTARRITGIVLAVLGALTNLGIYIASRCVAVMVPFITYQNGEKWYNWDGDHMGYSFRYFVEHYSLELLVALGVVLLIVGIYLITGKHLTRRGWKKSQELTEE